MKRLLPVLALLFAPSLALAQGVPLFQSGTVTPNHLLKSAGNGLQMDAGGLNGDANGRGLSPFSITDALGLGLCSNTAVTGGQHYAFCIGHDSAGNALLSATANGGAVEKSIIFRKNGTDYEIPFVGAGGGNVVGPATTTVDHVAVWNNAAGTLLKDVTSLGLTGLNVTGAPAALTITPTNQIASALTYNSTAAGTVTTTPTDTNQMAMWWLRHQGALVGSGVNRSIGVLEVDYNDTGTVVNDDSYTAVTGNCNLLGARANTGSARLAAGCVGVVAAARGVAHQGGTLGIEHGEIHGLNVVAGMSNLGVLPHDYYDVIGTEVNMTGCTGCTMKVRIGFNAIDFGNGGANDSEQGSRVDAAYNVSSVAGTRGWLYGIDFAGGPIYGGNAVDPETGQLFGSSADSPTIALHGINLENFNITGNAFMGPGGTFVVDGVGNVGAATITAQAGFISNAPLGTSAVITFSDTNVQQWQVGREATTDDFFMKNVVGGQVFFRVGAATNVTSIGISSGISITGTGGVVIPGVATTGTIAGSVCMAADKTLIYKVGAGACL